MKLKTFAVLSLVLLVATGRAFAQEAAPPKPMCPCPPPDPPPPVLQGSFSAGLALTTGNTDTSSFNLGFNMVYDPKTHSLFKADAFYLRSTNDGEATTDKAGANLRYEYKLTERFFAFAQLGYQRDVFKNITYLITPMLGAGYYVVKEKTLELTVDASIGGAFEKDSGFDATSSGAFALGQGFVWKISPTTTFTEKATGLWKTDDTSDCFYHFELGLAASLVKNFELKVSYLVDYKNLPNPPTLKKTDTALIAAIVYKF